MTGEDQLNCLPNPCKARNSTSTDRTQSSPIFDQDDQTYLTCCTLVHVMSLARTLVAVKVFVFGCLLLGTLNAGVPPLVQFGFFLAFGLALLSYSIMLLGMRRKRFHLFIPYFFVSFLLIVIAVVHLFVEFLDSANTRDTVSQKRMSSFVMQMALIAFEVYCLLMVWRVFVYVTDARSAEEVEERRLIKQKMYDNYEMAF